jgi:3-oxoacyl-[acyl-carrier protein] reductase
LHCPRLHRDRQGRGIHALAGYDGMVAQPEVPRRLNRPGQVEDCAKVVEFLCTDLSDFVTGHVIPVGGTPFG